MTATTFIGHFLGPDTHANRPAAAGVPNGTLYVCTTDSKIERVVSGAWADYATLGGSGGSAGALELIADVTIDALDSGGFPTGAPSGFDVTDIPGTYSDLLGVVSLRVPGGSPITVAEWQLNTITDYIYYQRQSDNTDWTTNTHYYSSEGGDNHFTTQAPGASADTDQFSEHSFLIPGYATTDRQKTVQIEGIVLSKEPEPDGRLIFFHQQIIGMWDSVAAIDQLSIGPSGLADGSRLRLYGRT